MKRGLRISIIVIVAFAFLVYAWIHRDTRTFTGSIAIDFSWSESQGFQETAVEWPHWDPLYSKLIAHQAEPFIAREIKDAGWRSAKGRLNVGAFLMLFVLGIDRLSDNNTKIVDPEVTPLMRAVEDGNGDLAARLISEGAPVNTQDQRGWTALMHASMNGHSREAAILLASGADINLKDKDGKPHFFGQLRTVGPTSPYSFSGRVPRALYGTETGTRCWIIRLAPRSLRISFDDVLAQNRMSMSEMAMLRQATWENDAQREVFRSFEYRKSGGDQTSPRGELTRHHRM